MLAYAEAGKGAPLVLLHAFPLSRAMWKRELERFAPLARVIAPDLPGFGGSPRQPVPSIEGMAKAVAGLLDQLNVTEPAIVAGLSMGGYVAFEFIRQFPQRVKALGLFSTRAAADSPEQRQGRMRLVEQLQADGVERLMTATLPKLVGRTTAASKPALMAEVEQMIRAADRAGTILAGDRAGNVPSGEGVSAVAGLLTEEVPRAAERAASPDGVIDALRAMAERRDSQPLLPGIRCPVLIIAGEEDALIPAQESRAMAQAIPGARLEIIPQAGHLVNLEQPEAFQSLLAPWLRHAPSSA